MSAQDIIVDSDQDLIIRNGDFEIGISEEQNIEHILLSNKGDWRQWGLLGVGLIRFVKGPSSLAILQRLKRSILLNLKYDEMDSGSVVVNDFDDITITATRKD